MGSSLGFSAGNRSVTLALKPRDCCESSATIGRARVGTGRASGAGALEEVSPLRGTEEASGMRGSLFSVNFELI